MSRRTTGDGPTALRALARRGLLSLVAASTAATIALVPVAPATAAPVIVVPAAAVA
jgi:hypothetical protein